MQYILKGRKRKNDSGCLAEASEYCQWIYGQYLAFEPADCQQMQQQTVWQHFCSLEKMQSKNIKITFVYWYVEINYFFLYITGCHVSLPTGCISFKSLSYHLTTLLDEQILLTLFLYSPYPVRFLYDISGNFVQTLQSLCFSFFS